MENDPVFAVKEGLLGHFEAIHGDPQAKWSLNFDFILSEVDSI